MENCRSLERRYIRASLPLTVLLIAGTFVSTSISATSVIPNSNSELASKVGVVVHGVVLSSEVAEDASGRPETVTVIAPP